MPTFRLKDKTFNYQKLANGQYVIEGKTPEKIVADLKQERRDAKYGRQLKLF